MYVYLLGLSLNVTSLEGFLNHSCWIFPCCSRTPSFIGLITICKKKFIFYSMAHEGRDHICLFCNDILQMEGNEVHVYWKTSDGIGNLRKRRLSLI